MIDDWLCCPECDERSVDSVPFPVVGRNVYFTCTNCDHRGVIVG